MKSRHISIDEEYFNKIKPYIERHNGNLGAALREIIGQAEKYNSQTVNVDMSLSDWIFKEAKGRLVPDNVIDEIIDPNLINSMKKLQEYLGNRFIKLDWDININLEADSDTIPSYVLIDIRGSPSKINVIAGILSKYLVRHSERSPLGIKSVNTFDEYIRIEFCPMNKNQAIKSLYTYFGHVDWLIKIIQDKPIFWKTIIEEHVRSNYNMVTIHRNHFEELLANDIHMGFGETIIEIMTQKIIQDIPLQELLYYIKQVYENSRIVDKIEIENKDLIIYHNYRNQQAVDKLKYGLIILLENSGYIYDIKLASNMIILRYKQDDAMKLSNAMKLSHIIESLKMKENDIDQELGKFLICLNGIIGEDLLSIFSLGRKTGKILIQEYEKANGSNWDIEKFKKFLEIIDSKLNRISELKLEDGNLFYTIRKCNIVKCNNIECENYICQAIREMFKGALSHAFGDNVKLEIKKLLSYGDNYCEVIIRTK